MQIKHARTSYESCYTGTRQQYHETGDEIFDSQIAHTLASKCPQQPTSKRRLILMRLSAEDTYTNASSNYNSVWKSSHRTLTQSLSLPLTAVLNDSSSLSLSSSSTLKVLYAVRYFHSLSMRKRASSLNLLRHFGLFQFNFLVWAATSFHFQ